MPADPTGREPGSASATLPGALWVALAAFLWGISGGIGGILIADGWDPFVVSLYRGAIGLVCVLAWLGLRFRGNGLASGRLWLWSAVAGLGVAGNFSFYFVGIAEGSVAVAATLMYCAPVFVYLVSFALGLERPDVLKWGAIGLVMCGIALLAGIHEPAARQVSAVGIGAGLLAGLSYAVFIFGFKFAAPNGSPQAILSIAFGVLVAVVAWPADAGQVAAVPTAPDRLLFAGLGILGAGLSFVIYIIGVHRSAPASASIVAMIEPVTASLFGVALLEERLGALQILGMALILVTVTALSVGQRRLNRA